jgi:site-specific DNA-methyltransferase (adenine-specific)
LTTANVFLVPDSFALLKSQADFLEQDFGVDVILTDPPYPEEVQDNLCSGSLVGTKSVPKYELDFDPLTAATRTWLDDALRIARRWVVTFCSIEDFGRYQDSLGKQYVRGAIWAKSNAMGQLTGDRPATAYEGVACLHRTDLKKRWNGRGSYGIWSCNGTRGKKGRHPNEKPIDLCLKLVALFSDRGETVFDPFCGSGAIGEACVRLGRGYIGLDQSAEWVEKTRARLAATAALPPVTDAEALALCAMWGRRAT